MRTLSFLLVLLLASAPLALADDDDDRDERENEGKEDKGRGRGGDDDLSSFASGARRRVELDVKDRLAEVKLKREDAAGEDSVKIEFDARRAQVQVKHELEERGGNETEEKLQARFRTLLEFVDGNGNGAYDPGERVVTAFALGSEKDAKMPVNGTAAWGPIQVGDVASANGTAGKKLSGRAAFGGNGTFGLDFYVYGDFAMIGNASLLPTEAKIDILIENYPYARADTLLAVIVDLKAEEKMESEGDDDERGFSAPASANETGFRLVFTWLDHATVDGVDKPVRSTLLKNEEESGDGEIEHKARVALAYARGAGILHDPTIGATYESQSDDGGEIRDVPSITPLVAVGVAGVIAVALGRRR